MLMFLKNMMMMLLLLVVVVVVVWPKPILCRSQLQCSSKPVP